MTMGVCNIAGVFYEFQPLEEGGVVQKLRPSGTHFFGLIVPGKNAFVPEGTTFEEVSDGIIHSRSTVWHVHQWQWKERERTFTKRNQVTGEEMHFRFLEKVMNTWWGDWKGTDGYGMFSCRIEDGNNQIPRLHLEERHHMRKLRSTSAE